MKSKYKITMFLTLAIALLLLLFGAGIYYFQSNYSYNDFYKRLETRAKLTAKYFFESNRTEAESIRRLRADHLEKLNEEKEYIIPADGSDFKQLGQTHAIPAGFLKEVYLNEKARLQNNDIFYYGIRYNEDKGSFLVIVTAKNDYATHYLALLRNILAGGIIIAIFIIASLTFYFSRHIFDPIRKITEKVNHISSDSFHLRLEEKSNDREIRELVSTFNLLLSRIETTFETHKNFISNASHEFGTPLTAIIGEADVALLKTRSETEYRDSLQRILDQAERLNKVSQSLLFLAQTGYRENRLIFEVLRMDELLLQAKEIMDKLVPGNRIQIDFSLLPEDPQKLKVKGNRELLTLAFTNVLNNACKYSDNQVVQIGIASTDSDLVMTIRDQGIGIPASELQYIYDPFFRASNAEAYEGYGIGLPLTRNIINIHKGSLDITSRLNEGVTVQINLPLAFL